VTNPALATAPADRAMRGIVVSNAITIAVVLLTGGALPDLLWPYWLQSIVIGWYARKRMLALTNFTTTGLTMNDAPVPATPEGARRAADFFALHYGLFHFGYLVFLTSFTLQGDATAALWTVVLGFTFVPSHRASHREHVEADVRGRPNLGTLMFLPYARVVPMHLMVMLGTVLGSGSGVLLFGALKTVADLAMHHVEHRVLQRARRG
jgi:hypothetical protein